MGEIIGGVATAVGGAIAAIAAGPFILAFGVIGYLAATASSILLSLAGILTGLAQSLQGLIISNQNVIVTIGWGIVRDVANLGFVLVIIIIAFGTILRFESYGAKKLLPKLIAAAILINFSLTIGGFFIDFANVLTSLFTDKISITPWSLGWDLLAAFGPQRFWKGMGEGGLGGAFASLTSGTIMLFLGPWFITIFNLIMFFVMIVLAVMLLIRFLELSFLLIIAPITWLFLVIPVLAGQFSKWWNKFLQWVFFAPIAWFFIYLSLLSVEKLGDFSRGGESSFVLDKIIKDIFMSGVEVILLSGFLLGGLIVAQSMSLTGAKAALGAVEGAGRAFGSWAVSKRGGRGLVGGFGRRIEQEWSKPEASGWKRAVSKFTTAGGLRTKVAGGLRGITGGPAGEFVRKVWSSETFGSEANPKGVLTAMWKGAKEKSGLFKERKKKGEEFRDEIEDLDDERLKEKVREIAEKRKAVKDKIEGLRLSGAAEYQIDKTREELADVEKKITIIGSEMDKRRKAAAAIERTERMAAAPPPPENPEQKGEEEE